MGAAARDGEFLCDRARRRGHGRPHRADRFLGAASSGSGNACGGDAVVGVEVPAHPLRHVDGSGLAHRPVGGEDVVRNMQHAFFHLVAVRHYAANEVVGSTGEGGELRRQCAACATLGRGEGQSGLGHGVGDEGGQRVEPFAGDVVAGDGAELLQGIVNLCVQRVDIVAAGGQPQAGEAGLGQVGEPDVAGQRQLPRLDEVAQKRLADTLHTQGFVDDVTGGKPFTQARDDALAHQPLHLERHARQRDHHLGVWRVGNIEPHARGGAEGVVEHRAAAGHPGLLPVDVGELAAEGSHALPHIVEGLFVLVQLAVEKVAKHLFGEVVLGGTEPAGDNHNVTDFQAVA